MNNNELAVRENQAAIEQPMNGNKSMIRGVGMQAPLSMNELKFFGTMVHEAGLIPKLGNESIRQTEARAMARIIAGHSYGFDPILSLSSFDVINGKIVPTSGCVSLLIKRSGRYNYKVTEWTNTVCDLLFVGKATDGTWKALGHSRFTIEDARLAGYTTGPNKQNYEKIPRNMLLARAITNGKRLFCADVMDPAGYFGQSGLEVTESLQEPDDLEFVEAPELTTGEVLNDVDAGAVDAEYDGKRDEVVQSIMDMATEKIGDPEDIDKFMKGRTFETMDFDALVDMQKDLAAL